METTYEADDYKIKISRNPRLPHCPHYRARVTSSKGSKSFDVSKPISVPPTIHASMRAQGLDPADFFWAGYVIRNAARPLFDEVWAEQEEAERKVSSLHRAKENAIEGLAELRAARSDHERYRREFNAMMEDEYNDGVNPPRGPKADAAELATRYPRAATYLRAESYSLAAHWAKSKAGHQAMEIILNGGMAAEAEAKLENWMADNKVEVD